MRTGREKKRSESVQTISLEKSEREEGSEETYRWFPCRQTPGSRERRTAEEEREGRYRDQRRRDQVESALRGKRRRTNLSTGKLDQVLDPVDESEGTLDERKKEGEKDQSTVRKSKEETTRDERRNTHVGVELSDISSLEVTVGGEGLGGRRNSISSSRKGRASRSSRTHLSIQIRSLEVSLEDGTSTEENLSLRRVVAGEVSGFGVI